MLVGIVIYRSSVCTEREREREGGERERESERERERELRYACVGFKDVVMFW